MTFESGRAVRDLGLALLGTALAVSCARDIELGSDQVTSASGAGRTGGASGTAAGAPDTGGAGGATACEPASCRGKVYACGNCDDDDDDGLIDADDPECTGPCDDLEQSLGVGLPGENSSGCQEDCYFDRGNGLGGGDCRFSHACDPVSVAPDYPPSGDATCAYDESTKLPGGNESCADLAAAQSDACTAECGPLTPNGCDCFGCCELPAGSGKHVWLGSSTNGAETCTSSTLGDASVCRPCTPAPSCFNDCKPCELCVGRPAPLPSCDSPTTSACDLGYRSCGRTTADFCPRGSFCITGCCIPEPR
jgi:hypothetical protein